MPADGLLDIDLAYGRQGLRISLPADRTTVVAPAHHPAAPDVPAVQVMFMAGLAVGLFFTPSSQVAIPQAIGLGNAAAITLTAAGLAFLAGYGSEAFFSMLDQLIGLKFRVIDPNKPNQRHDT